MSAALKVGGELDRRTYLGGSDCAGIMRVGATYDGVTQTPYTVWRKKIGELDDGVMDPDRELFLKRRKRWEGPIVEMLREEFGGKIVNVNQRYIDREHDFLAAEIDFEWEDSDGSTQNGEIKTVHPIAFGERHGWGEAGTSDIPVWYAGQVMHGLSVTDRRVCVVAAMIGIDNMIFYRIDRDEETIAAIRAEEVRFWNEHVLTRLPPDPQTVSDMKHLLLRMNGRPVQIDEPTRDRLERMQAIRAQKKALEDEDDELFMAIGDFIRFAWGAQPGQQIPDDDAILMLKNRTVASYRKTRGASLDQKRLKAEHPEITTAYTREFFYRKLYFPKPK